MTRAIEFIDVGGEAQLKPEERATTEFFAKIGIVATIMAASPIYCAYPVACISVWLDPPIRHDQIYIFRNESGTPVGYFTWAWLADDTEKRLIDDPNVLLHISEWNEGDRLWILDFVLISGEVRRRLVEAWRVLAKPAMAKSVRRDNDGRVRRITTWRGMGLQRISR